MPQQCTSVLYSETNGDHSTAQTALKGSSLGFQGGVLQR